MTLQRATAWMALLASALLVAACDGAGSGGDTIAAARIAGDTTENDVDPPPELDRPWQEMSSAELIAHIKGLRYRPRGSSQTAHRDCVGAKASRDCTLLIMPVQGVRNFDPGRVAKQGAIIARIENLGTRQDSVLGIRPDEFAYWFVGRDSAGSVVADLLDLTAERPQSLRRLGFGGCDQLEHPPHPETRAAFQCCGGSCPQVQTAAGPVTDPNAPMWITCALGCCESEDPGGGP